MCWCPVELFPVLMSVSVSVFVFAFCFASVVDCVSVPSSVCASVSTGLSGIRRWVELGGLERMVLVDVRKSFGFSF